MRGWSVLMLAPPLLVGAGLVAGCAGRGTGEQMGDEAYAAARYADALAAYRAALKDDPSARLWGKAGAAALHVGDLPAAAEAYLRLAGEDPTRAEEAAEGLEATARAAERSGDDATLEAAVSGLQAIAPERPLGRYAFALARKPGADAADLAELLPRAIAAAEDAATVDSLLTVYASALRETNGCDQAIPVFRSAYRRLQQGELRARAGSGVAGCALALGIRAQSAGRLEVASQWYAEAAAVSAAPDSIREAATSRLAELGLRDTLGNSVIGAPQ